MKSKLKSKGSLISVNDIKMSAYLKPETEMTLNQMITVFKIRTDTIDLPGYLPFKYSLGMICRAGCDAVEDICHLINCENDNINEKGLNTKNINDLFTDTYSSSVKTTINKLKRIMTLKDRINLKSKELKITHIVKEPVISKVLNKVFKPPNSLMSFKILNFNSEAKTKNIVNDSIT